MDYITVSETAVKWGVSERWVYKYVKDGRVKGAVRFGAVWMIPAAAEKPGDPRFEKKTSVQNPFQTALDRAIAAVYNPWPRDDPYRILNAIGDEKLRLVPEAALAYIRGDFEHVKRCFKKTEGDDAAKLLASVTSVPAAISMGDYTFFRETEHWLKGIIKTDLGAGVTAYAQYALAGGYMGAYAPDMIAEWIKNGDFTDLHPLVRYEATNRRVDYLNFLKKFESMLDTAQAAMSLLGLSDTVLPEKELSITEINLRVRSAVACNYLGRVDEAKSRLMAAMDKALPHGFITPFAEMVTWLGDLITQCLNQAYPQWHDAVTGQAGGTLANWITFHNRFTKDNITLMLTLREMGIATLAVRRVPYKTIAEQYHVSLGRLKVIMNGIYGKLQVHSREELSEFIP